MTRGRWAPATFWLCSTLAIAGDAGAVAVVAIPEADAGALDEAVRAQILAARAAAVALAAEAPLRPAALASALGELGQVYQAYELDSLARECYDRALEIAGYDADWLYLSALLAADAG